MADQRRPAGLRRIGRVIALSLCLAACGERTGPTVQVVIPPGASMRVAAESLSKAGVIKAPRLFRFYAGAQRKDRQIKAGTYVFQRGSGWRTALSALGSGKGLVHVIVIPEGFSLAQIVPVIASRLGVSKDSVLEAARDTMLRRQLDIPTETLEGYLFPDTYTFPPGTPPRDVVRTMVRRFQQVWKPAWTARSDSIPMSRHDILTLASIVEREARVPQERPVIAGVYMNRLRKGMLLQADPTVQYALPEYQSRLLYKHLEIESPYNTYKYAGLPPGPIGSPGRASIEAALYPASVPYLYFVAFPDGHHEFRVDLQGHERAKAEARRAWNAVAAARAGRSSASRGSDSSRAALKGAR